MNDGQSHITISLKSRFEHFWRFDLNTEDLIWFTV